MKAKIIDVDKLFDEYISDYVYSNIGKVKPEEIENQIPVLYEKFGDARLKELDNLTPNTYYKSFSGEENLQTLKEHLEKKVPVSDFLCEALEESVTSEAAIKKELEKELDEEYTLYLMNILSSKNSSVALDRYLEFVTMDYSEGIREFATETLSLFANDVKDKVLSVFKSSGETAKECLAEILSHVTKKSDKIFDILVEEFVKHQDKIPVYASYLSRYGDERALPFLKTAIEAKNISYADFEELRFAIEALGGEYEDKRDFTADKTYKKIKAKQEAPEKTPEN